MNTEGNAQVRRRLATDQQFVADRKGILLQQSMMDMAGFLKVDKTIMFLNRRGLIEFLSYLNDTLAEIN